MDNKKRNLWILLAAVVVIVVIIIVAANNSQKAGTPGDQASQPTTGEAAPADEGTVPEGEDGTEVEVNPVLKDATIEVPGANPITKDNKVVTSEGEPVKNDVVPMTPEAPQQTGPVDKESLSNDVTQIEITATGFNPAEFTVRKGDAVTFGVTSGDQFTHVFMFDDPSLSAVAVGVGPGETRAISFNAPDTAGEYTFHCDVPGHAGRGEVGKMIVR